MKEALLLSLSMVLDIQVRPSCLDTGIGEKMLLFKPVCPSGVEHSSVVHLQRRVN